MNLAATRRAADIIRAGGVVAYPTEACFGLGCDPRNRRALRRILRIKRRARAQGLILIADRIGRLAPFVGDFDVACRAEMLASWPGRHTWILPAAPAASGWLRGAHATVAVRVTAHRGAAQLCRLAGMAVVSTSANRSGRRMLRTAADVLREFGDEVDCVLDGRIGRAREPSVIRDGASGAALRG